MSDEELVSFLGGVILGYLITEIVLAWWRDR